MNASNRFGTAIIGALSLLAAGSAAATTFTGNVLRDVDDDYSYYLERAEIPPIPGGPMSNENDLNRFFFASDATIEFDFTGGIISSDTSQFFFPLTDGNGEQALLELVSFTIDTNDTDGFLSGSATVSFNSGSNQEIVFADENRPDTPFNSSFIENGELNVFLSGRTLGDGPQLNLAFSAVVGDPMPMPEPGTLALLALGALSFAAARRRS